jgi:hypothetical protein
MANKQKYVSLSMLFLGMKFCKKMDFPQGSIVNEAPVALLQ